MKKTPIKIEFHLLGGPCDGRVIRATEDRRPSGVAVICSNDGEWGYLLVDEPASVYAYHADRGQITYSEDLEKYSLHYVGVPR